MLRVIVWLRIIRPAAGGNGRMHWQRHAAKIYAGLAGRTNNLIDTDICVELRARFFGCI